MKQKDIKQNIIAYGFEILGFNIPENSSQIIAGDFTIQFFPYGEVPDFNNIHGIIIPQGIFENIKVKPNYFQKSYDIEHSGDLVSDFEKKILNFVKDKGWVCFLVRDIYDTLPGDYPCNAKDVSKTDLCKRILNRLDIRRRAVNDIADIHSKYDEFKWFTEDFGVAKTTFTLYSDYRYDYRILSCHDSDNITGLEVVTKFFFLPFHTTNIKWENLKSFIPKLAASIYDYRKKRLIETPLWLNDFQFVKETELIKTKQELEEQLEDVKTQLQNWNRYKAILTTSGENLKNIAISMLENFFELKIDPTDNLIEDAKILDENDGIIAVIEFKGTNKGIKREYINQVDTHRERLGLSANTMGLLIINNEMDIEGIDSRLATIVSEEQIKHAKKFNVLIIRTVDLLFLMKHLENNTDRKTIFLNLIKDSGWLCADKNEYKGI